MTQGSRSVRVTDKNELIFSWETVSRDESTKTSTISWRLRLTASFGAEINTRDPKGYSITVGDKSYTGSCSLSISENNVKTLASGMVALIHNENGDRSFSYSFSVLFDMTLCGIRIGEKAGSGTGQLEPFFTPSRPSSADGYFGSEVTINTGMTNIALTHTLRYSFLGQSGVIAEGVGASFVWTLPLSFIELLPEGTSATVRVYADTYYGDELIGCEYCDLTAYVPEDIIPSCTITVRDISGVSQIYGSPVKGLSRFEINVIPAMAYSSPIKAFLVNGGGAVSASDSLTTDVIRSSGEYKITARVTDGRGRVGSCEETVTLLDYSPPAITRLTVHRCNSDGTENDRGDSCRVKFYAQVSEMGGLNTASYTLKYKKPSDRDWTVEELSELDGVYSVRNESYIFSAEEGSSYDVEISVTDRHNAQSPAKRGTSVSTAFCLADIHRSGRGLRLGGVADKEDTLQCDLSLCLTANRFCYTSYNDVGRPGYLLMARIQHITVVTDAPIVFVFTRRYAPSPMTVYVRFASLPTQAEEVLGSMTYEGSDYGAYIVRSGTATWDLYVAKGSAYDSLTLHEWYTSAGKDWYTLTEYVTTVDVSFPGELVSELPPGCFRAAPAAFDSILNYIYPVGSLLAVYEGTDPSVQPGGVWELITESFGAPSVSLYRRTG